MLTVEQLKELKVGDWVWLVQRQDKMPDICAYVEIVPISDNKYLRVGVDGHIVHIPIEKYGTKWIAYKNKEEAEGKTSITLPCKVGDTVWYIENACYFPNLRLSVEPITVTEISWKYNKSGKDLGFALIANGARYKFSSIGKTVFLTKDDAVAKLKELQEKQNEIIKNS